METVACRETLEETGLVLDLMGQLHNYSDPDRDFGKHNTSTVFVGQATGEAQA
jgi:ADP-ribose pyrophosphatase YjhB (NUDIX family)